ncbi:MAG: hypothetical protein PHQ40_09255 [Anaerolineaceae bacterium]|nr:hypothetical protein [Anaerolineaceae bacterium]
MAEKSWQPLKVQYCSHAGDQVRLEAQLVLPAEFLPDPPARVVAHRCSHAYICNLQNQASCVWSGTNPSYDPFTEKA